MAEALQSQTGAAFSKYLGAYQDAAATGANSTLNVDSLTVGGDAEIFGQLSVAALAPTSLGPYTQAGAVDFGYSPMSNVNVTSGTITNANINNSNGFFKYLYSGSPGVGYQTVFYGSAPNVIFDWNGLKNTLNINSTITLDLESPVSTSRLLQVAPRRPNAVVGALVTDVEGGTVTGDFTGVGVHPGDYLSLSDGTVAQVTSVAVDRKSVVAATGDLSWKLTKQQPETYTVHNAGWYFDDQGNLVGEGYGYLKLPQVDTLTDASFYPQKGLLRWNQYKNVFEGYEGGTQGWVPIASSGSLTNKSFSAGAIVDTAANGNDQIRFFTAGQNAMFINAQQQVSIGTSTPNAGQLFQVAGNAEFDGTITGQELAISHSASVLGSLYVGSSLVTAGAFQIQSSGSVLGNLWVGSSATVAGSLAVLHDFFGAASGTFLGGLFVGGSSTVAGSLTVERGASITGDLDVGGNLHLHGTLTVDGPVLFNATGSFAGSLSVGSGLSVMGTVLAGAASVTGPLTVGQSAYVGGSLSVGSGLSVIGTVLAGAASVTGSLVLGGTVSAPAGSFGGLFGTSLVLQGDANVGGSLTLNGTLTVNNNVFVYGTITALAGNFLYGGSGTGGGGGTILAIAPATLTGTALTILTYASVLGGLSVGSALVAGSVAAQMGSFTDLAVGTIVGNLYVAGTITALAIAGAGGSGASAFGTIGAPTGRSDYGSLDVAGLLPSDLVPDAFYKIEQVLDSMFTLPSTPNGAGQHIVLCSQETLSMAAGSVYAACVAGSAQVVTDVYTSTLPATNVLINMYDGSKGTLSALVDGTSAGTLNVAAVPLGVGTTSNGFLCITAKADFYASNPQLAGQWYYINALVQPPAPLAPGPAEHSYQVYHSRSGLTNTVYFRVDDSTTPTIVGALAVTIGTATQVVSGVRSYTAGAPVAVTGTVAGAIQSYYNSTYGLAALSGTGVATAYEKNSGGRVVSGYTPGSTHVVALQTSFASGAYSEAVTLTFKAYNAVGGSASATVAQLGGLPIRVDTASSARSAQVTSGSGDFPAVPGIDFGAPYDDSASLLANVELQQLGGVFGVPVAVNYTQVNPASSYDYRSVNSGVSYRFATFAFQLANPVSNLVLSFSGQVGSGWGSGSTIATGLKLHVRIVNAALGSDTAWLDANALYTGGPYPRANGDACLLVANTTATQKSLTLGVVRSGVLYVRVGLSCTDGSGKGFASVGYA